MIETVGKTIRVMGRKDLNMTKIEDLRGKKVANQTGSSTGNIFVDQLGPKHGLKKGDYQEVRMNVNDMVAAMAAKTVDAMVCVEPYNAIAEADGIATTIVNFTGRRSAAGLHGGNAGIRAKSIRTPWSPTCKAWLEVAQRLQEPARQGARTSSTDSSRPRATI